VTLRAALAAADQGDRAAAADLGIDLSGYNWYRDFSIGVSRNSPDQLRAFIISRASDSSIYIFDSGGKLITDAANLGEILSIELFDFDGDNRDEIITRQKTGWGTGVYREEFVIYGLKGTQALQTLWRATSYAYSDLGSEREFEEETAFIRPSYQRLIYTSTIEMRGKRKVRRSSFKFDGERFVRAAD